MDNEKDVLGLPLAFYWS